jgi:accessory gene regulator B
MKNMSRRLAQELGTLLNSDDNDIEIYSYSMEILILLLATMVCVTFLALLLGSVRTTFAFLAVFAVFRCFGGGAHLSSGKRCVFVSTVMLVAFGYLGCILVPTQQILFILLTVTILAGQYTIMKWVPAGTAKHQITDNKLRFIQKINMSVSLLIYTAVTFLLITAGILTFAFSLTLGAIISLLLITPLGYGIITVIDNAFDILIKKEVSNNV